MKASEKLKSKNSEGKFICIGLDTDLEKIPQHVKTAADPIIEFNRKIIEATHDLAAAYKINFAFYEKLGAKGADYIGRTLELIPDDLLTIADAKRGDIGNSSKYYAESVFNNFNFDSVTVNPYMGEDSVRPFLDFEERLVFILVLTSNPGAADFEKLQLINGEFLFQKVIEKVHKWNVKNNCGIVFGATNLPELRENLISFENVPVLLPGVGVQGGSLTDVMKLFLENNRSNLIVTISRGIIYKDNSPTFDVSAREELIRLNRLVSELL